jgi:hypothetical protein
MLIVKNKRYITKHTIGGAGIFDTISNFFKRVISSSSAKNLASVASKAASSDIGKAAATAAKTAGKEITTAAISGAKDLAIQKVKQLIDKTSTKMLEPKNVEVIKQITGLEPTASKELTNKSKDILAKLINSSSEEVTTNINKIMMGHGINSSKAIAPMVPAPKAIARRAPVFEGAIRIEDLVRKMNKANGSGLRLA